MTNATETASPSLSETETIIAEMLRENTGAHFLDSGSAYGRHHERNRHITDEMWKASEPVSLTFRWGSPDITKNVFHFLAENLEHDADVDRLLRIIEAARDTYGLETVREFFDVLRTEADAEPAGLYGEGEPMEVNTYNGNDIVSQTLQYTYASLSDVSLPLASLARIVAETEPDSFARDIWKDIIRENRQDAYADGSIRIDGCFVFLQIHGGCDVRGGYTDVRAFQENGMTELGILDNARASIFDASVDNPNAGDLEHPAYWSTDDGCSFYADGGCGAGCHPQLETFPIVESEADAETTDRIASEARGLAERAIAEHGKDAGLYLSILAEALEGLPYHRDIAYRLAASIAEPVSRVSFTVRWGDRETERERIEASPYACILVDEDGNGRSPYTGGRLEASPF